MLPWRFNKMIVISLLSLITMIHAISSIFNANMMMMTMMQNLSKPIYDIHVKVYGLYARCQWVSEVVLKVFMCDPTWTSYYSMSSAFRIGTSRQNSTTR